MYRQPFFVPISKNIQFCLAIRNNYFIFAALNEKCKYMAISTTNSMSTVDALWTLISPLDNLAKKELTQRINNSLIMPMIEKKHRATSQSVEDILNGFHLHGNINVPADEMGKGAVALNKYV